jgi:hypothetical protein
MTMSFSMRIRRVPHPPAAGRRGAVRRGVGGVVFAVLLVSCALPGGSLPLTVEDCGWPADTELAFEGWSTEAGLGFQRSDPTGARRYWLISKEAVPFMTTRGEGMARGACSVGDDGLQAFQVIP